TLFLDSRLRIKRFTERVTELFSITPADEGRPITDFAHQLDYDELAKDARAVLINLGIVKRDVRSRSGRWYDVRMRPYRTVDEKIDCVVTTFVDVSEYRTIEQALRASELQLMQQKRMVELSRDPIFVWAFDGAIEVWNRGCEELYGYSPEEAIGKRKDQLLDTVVPGSSFAQLRERLLATGSWSGEVQHRTKDGRVVTVEAELGLETMEGRRLVLESTRDITQRKIFQARQQLLLGELTHRVK